MSYKIEKQKNAFRANHFKYLLPRPHIHTHLELVYLKEGKTEVVLDNKKYVLEAGELFIAFPNQIHFYHDQTPVEGCFLIFSPEIVREFKEIFQTKIPMNPIVHADCFTMDVWDGMQKILRKLEDYTSFDEIVAKGYLLAILGEMFSHMEFSNKPGDQETIKKILSYCIENYTEPLTLECLAKDLYLNKYYISHIFQERMNTHYKDFINQLRIEHACGLLKEDSRITEIAYASGFSTVRTFNRAFLKYMNMTPREYIKKRHKSTI